MAIEYSFDYNRSTIFQGKPIKEAEGEVAFSASFFEWFAGEGRRNYGDVIPATLPGKQLITLREPIGVAALITPVNFIQLNLMFSPINNATNMNISKY